MANAMGLPNPGAEAAARTLARVRRTGPRFASVADEALEDVLATYALLEPQVDGVELNASCPNVSWGRDRDNEAHLAALLHELGARRRTPLFVKLPPFRADVEREVVLALAHIAVEGGANGLVCSNTRPVAEPRLAVGAGGLSGRALFEDTLRILDEVRAATQGAVPIVASGGVSSTEDALACLRAGAAAVQVYTALVFRGPRLVGELTAGLANALRGNGTALGGVSPTEPSTRAGLPPA
jgi:dihydroorotate dehydrogenase